MIRDNHAAVALYQSLGFTRRYGLCGYLSAEPLAAAPGVLQPYPIPALLRRAVEESNSQPPADGSAYLRHPAMPRRDAGTARLRGTGHLGLTACTAVLWVEPAARRQGLARALLMALAQQFPGIGTSVTVRKPLRRCLPRRDIHRYRCSSMK